VKTGGGHAQWGKAACQRCAAWALPRATAPRKSLTVLAGVNATLESCIGVPINYHLKPITRTQLAQMWVSKYYPNKYLDIQGDDAPRPKKDAAPAS
jgi:hypothetical protein